MGYTTLMVSPEVKDMFNQFKERFFFRNNSEALFSLIKLAEKVEKELGEEKVANFFFSVARGKDDSLMDKKMDKKEEGKTREVGESKGKKIIL